jgi:hypothetical protein
VLFCELGNHVDLRGLPGGAEGIRTGGHRGRGEISSWIAAWVFARPLTAASAEDLLFARPPLDIGEEERTLVVTSA